MTRLYEWEAKGLLQAHGIPVPHGRRWDPSAAAAFAAGVVVKAQTLGGQRGLRGGIVMTASPAQTDSAAGEMLGSWIGAERVDDIYLEERVAVVEELYLAILIDREAGMPRILLGAQGGVEVEAAPEAVASLTVPLDIGPRPWVVRELVRRAGLPAASSETLEPIIRAAWDAFVDEDMELLEINPLARTPDGSLVALDARVILDTNATSRHPGWPQGGVLGSPFELRCEELGAVGVEMDGDIVAIVSGAGLMMATVDLLVDRGGSVRAAVDLGGLVLREADELADLVVAVAELRPRAVLVNAFFQLATCDALARKLSAGIATGRLEVPLVVRLRGREDDEAERLLAPFGVIWEPDLERACVAVVHAAGGTTTGRA